MIAQQYLEFTYLDSALYVRAINKEENIANKYELNKSQFSPQLSFIYKDLQKFYEVYVTTRRNLISLSIKDGQSYLICRIPFQHLSQSEYPAIQMKLTQIEQDPSLQIRLLKNRILKLQQILQKFTDSFKAKNYSSSEIQSISQKYLLLEEKYICDKKKYEELEEKFNNLSLFCKKLEKKVEGREQNHNQIGMIPKAMIEGVRYYVYVITSSQKVRLSKKSKIVGFLIGGGASAGRGGTKNRGGGGSGYLQYFQKEYNEETVVDAVIGEGGIINFSSNICEINEEKNNGKPTIFDDVTAQGGKTSGLQGVLIGGSGGSGGGAGQGSNCNSGGDGGSKGNQGLNAIYQDSFWKGGQGKSSQKFVLAVKYGLIPGKGGQGGLGNANGYQAGGGGGGLVIPTQFYNGITPNGGNGQGQFSGKGGQGFGGGGGGGSYDNKTYHFGGNGAQGCIILFIS